MRRLPMTFYRRSDAVAVARDLLGKVLCTRIRQTVTKAVITEAEAYAGVADKASHAYGDRRTNRTEPMYSAGGVAYVYLCYGIHHLFNVVAGPRDEPLAVLIRGAEPLEGLPTMRRRRNLGAQSRLRLSGPGVVSQALGIRTTLSGASLLGPTVWIEDHAISVPDADICVGPRIGVDYAGEDAQLPYRFRAAISPGV